MSSDDKLRAVVIGCGGGATSFLKALSCHKRYVLAGAADLNKDVLKNVKHEYNCPNVYTDYTKMFSEIKPDVVCVHTYPPSHHLIVREVLKHPVRGLITEKPLGDTVEHGREIVKNIKAKLLPVQIPHGNVLIPRGKEVLERVKNGQIGDIQIVEIQNRYWDFINAGIHWFHYFIMLTGNEDIDWVMCATESSTKTYRDGMRVETTGVSYIKTASGKRCICNIGDEVDVAGSFDDLSYRIIGTEGIIEWGNGGEFAKGYFIQNKEYPVREYVKATSKGNKTDYLDILADEIENGRPDYRNIDASMTALELVEASYLSSKYGQKILFPWNKGKIAKLKTDDEFWPGIPYDGKGGMRDGKTFYTKEK
ncbi:Gfo/Idh/MocA family oxidoreductase [bacterium]|nr:Gfo/Idh/MocA family oxidoreductase [bacterium]